MLAQLQEQEAKQRQEFDHQIREQRNQFESKIMQLSTVSSNQSDQAAEQAQAIIENLRNENQNLFSQKEQKEAELHQMKE